MSHFNGFYLKSSEQVKFKAAAGIWQSMKINFTLKLKKTGG